MELEVTTKIEKQDEDEMFQGLQAYNLPRLEDKEPRDLGVYLRDGEGRLQGGLTGTTHGNWLFVKYLWVREELRGRGLGSRLLQRAEEAARDRDCRFAFLNTFGFQAPEFYRRHDGYVQAFVLENYPRTGKRYYFTKTL